MDLLKQLPAEDWKKAISTAYFKHGLLNKDDAKIKFLEIIYQWPTFGSAFFEVKVSAQLFIHFAIPLNVIISYL
jgi:myosin VIIa